MIFLVERIVTSGRPDGRAERLAAPIFLELGYAMFLQACFMTSIVQILLGRKAGWNYVPRPAVPAVLTPLLFAPDSLTTWGILLPASVLTTGWYAALAYWVGFNTLVFAFLSVLHLLPPMHRLRGLVGSEDREPLDDPAAG